jgi:hypothetical protein
MFGQCDRKRLGRDMTRVLARKYVTGRDRDRGIDVVKCDRKRHGRDMNRGQGKGVQYATGRDWVRREDEMKCDRKRLGQERRRENM